MTLGIKHLLLLDAIVIIVVLSIVSFTFFAGVADIQDNYCIETPEDCDQTFNQINETLIYTVALQEKLINSPAGEQTSTDWLRNSMNNVIKSIMTIPSALGVVGGQQDTGVGILFFGVGLILTVSLGFFKISQGVIAGIILIIGFLITKK